MLFFKLYNLAAEMRGLTEPGCLSFPDWESRYGQIGFEGPNRF